MRTDTKVQVDTQDKRPDKHLQSDQHDARQVASAVTCEKQLRQTMEAVEEGRVKCATKQFQQT